jgi:hypothetical protein
VEALSQLAFTGTLLPCDRSVAGFQI